MFIFYFSTSGSARATNQHAQFAEISFKWSKNQILQLDDKLLLNT